MRERAHSGLGCTILRRGRRGLACAALALGAVLGSPAAGLGDTAPIPFSASVPGAGPSHATALEQLASRIASHIAGRRVSVRCNGDAGRLLTSTAALAPEICWPLQQFAEATTKPTRCGAALVPCYRGGRSTAKKSPAYWAAYDLDAFAILTLAHESAHLSGAKVSCSGMQWIPYVAEQLGDTSGDAQAIARYAWDNLSPRHLPARCRPTS